MLASPEMAIHAQTQPMAEVAVAANREAVLRRVLPSHDYDDARRMGLIDMFYYDPATGEDGLMHVLAGNVITGEDGSTVAQGFHHEESGARAWGMVVGDDGQERPITRVDRTHLETAKSNTRRNFIEHLAEPYLAQVAIEDRPKMAVRTVVQEDGTTQRTIEAAKSSMYPKEYDALAVLQTVRIAYENMDPANDILSRDHNGHAVIMNESEAPLIDGVSMMPVRLILDAETKKIVTAIPVVKKRTGIMGLTPEQLQAHITYQHVA